MVLVDQSVEDLPAFDPGSEVNHIACGCKTRVGARNTVIARDLSVLELCRIQAPGSGSSATRPRNLDS